MTYPQLNVHLGRLAQNAETVVRFCKDRGISVAGVTKGIRAIPEVGRLLLDSGCEWLADSRMDNIHRMRAAGIEGPFLLLRIPMPDELEDLVRSADCSLVSMSDTIALLDRECERQQKDFSVILMVDMGDLREGIWPDELRQMAETFRACPRVRCLGVGANFGCLSGVLPTPKNLTVLADLAEEMEAYLGYRIEVVSGGATSSLKVFEDGFSHPRVNQLRVGEGILLGRDVTGLRNIPWLRQDTLSLEAQVIEVRRKPSFPIGEIGADAFGNVPTFEDKGVRLRAIVAVGRQDVRPEGLFPFDKGIEILGASSDHLTLDVEDLDRALRVGDILSFHVDYGAMLAAVTSPYVEVRLLEE